MHFKNEEITAIEKLYLLREAEKKNKIFKRVLLSGKYMVGETKVLICKN